MKGTHTWYAAALSLAAILLPQFAGSIHAYVAAHPVAGAIFSLLAATTTTVAAAGPGIADGSAK